MLKIEEAVNHIEAILAIDKKKGVSRFTTSEIESMRKIIEVVKQLDQLFNLMDRLAPEDINWD